MPEFVLWIIFMSILAFVGAAIYTFIEVFIARPIRRAWRKWRGRER